MINIIFGFLVFLLAVIFLIYFPGFLIVSFIKKYLKKEETVSLSFVVGIVLFIIQAVIFGLIKLRFLSYFYFSGLFFILFLKFKYEPLLYLKSIFKDKLLLGLLVVGIVVQVLINFPSGLIYDGEMFFWSSQGHDGLWHVSLIREIARNFPPQNPLYPGNPLVNYHYSVDILMGDFFRLIKISPLDLYFRFFPILFSFLFGLTGFVFANRIWGRTVALFSVLFIYFSGGFGYIHRFLNGNIPIGGETVFWASQNTTILGNPPHALGIILITSFSLVLYLWLKNSQKHFLFILILIGFAVSTVKMSAGAMLVAGMIGLSLVRYLKNKKLDVLFLALLLSITNFSLLKLLAKNAESFLIFNPLWFPRTMMVSRLGDMDWELKRQHYYWVGGFKGLARAVQFELYAILLFVIGNTGTRLIGLVVIFKKFFKKKLENIDWFLIFSAISGFGVILIFVQNGVTYNFIQFIQIFFHIMSFYAACCLASLLKTKEYKFVKIGVIVLLIILTIPSGLGSLYDFYGKGKIATAKISSQELDALDFVSTNVEDEKIILTKPFDYNAKYRYHSSPIPIHGWYSTSYIHALTGRYVFISAEEQLDITGYDFKDKLIETSSFFDAKPVYNNDFLKKYQIGYIYLHKDELEGLSLVDKEGLQTVFENNEIIIFEVI